MKNIQLINLRIYIMVILINIFLITSAYYIINVPKIYKENNNNHFSNYINVDYDKEADSIYISHSDPKISQEYFIENQITLYNKLNISLVYTENQDMADFLIIYKNIYLNNQDNYNKNFRIYTFDTNYVFLVARDIEFSFEHIYLITKILFKKNPNEYSYLDKSTFFIKNNVTFVKDDILDFFMKDLTLKFQERNYIDYIIASIFSICGTILVYFFLYKFYFLNKYYDEKNKYVFEMRMITIILIIVGINIFLSLT